MMKRTKNLCLIKILLEVFQNFLKIKIRSYLAQTVYFYYRSFIKPLCQQILKGPFGEYQYAP